MPSFQLHIIYNKTFKKDKPSFLKAPHIQVHSRKLSFLLFLKQVKRQEKISISDIPLRELIQQIVNIQFKRFQKLLVDKQKSVNKKYRLCIALFLM
ncbi:hypothetical protein BCSJ1_20658 [Bacillus cereus SJ1]|nr:hypothetical protein BCSJ1_20658 [Bacillus cereus SJ1]